MSLTRKLRRLKGDSGARRSNQLATRLWNVVQEYTLERARAGADPADAVTDVIAGVLGFTAHVMATARVADEPIFHSLRTLLERERSRLPAPESIQTPEQKR